ncbi:hypothetical protein KIN20_038183 [Parelaphostrongylus tenuis]|uniref:Uncharacterized protein n=1 Tax=Parelaphostrongylus tenuis TaxID=148309 RepID=A0AAD5RII7_PARTN|nr:hypothetical protein KIN20_038183 [Parelaphostrongylus tenuis]
MSGSDVDSKEVSADKNEPVTAETAGGDVAEESRDSAASLDNDEKSYSGSEEKNGEGESEDGGEDEEGGDDEEEGGEGDEENGKEEENGHVNSTDTNGNDRKRMSDAGGDEARSGAPALKKKKGDDEEVGAGDVQAESVTAE